MYQAHLVHQLKAIFPHEQTFVNVRKEAGIIREKENTCEYLELDVWLPNLFIAFEFQDAYHYVTTWYTHKTKEKIRLQDSDKKWIVKQKGIELITVPCWWDGEISSLVASILFQRPDIPIGDHLKFCSFPIPFNEKENFFQTPEVPEVGELMLASFPVDPFFNETFSPHSWWVGEKYDGLRCCWNSNSLSLYNRAGRKLDLMDNIISTFPSNIFLDCELWFGRGLFSHSHLLHKGFEYVPWHQLRILAFDVPLPSLFEIPFEQRYHYLLSSVSDVNPFLNIAVRVLGENSGHLNGLLESINSEGGEGVIMRRVNSFYENGRTPSLLKLKSFQGDKEGIVVEIRENDVVIEMPNKISFAVPNEHVLVRVAKGDIVSFSFSIHAKRDIPVNPKIFRIRRDVHWDDVLANYASESKFINDQFQGANFDMTSDKMSAMEKEMKLFMENIAQENQQDPQLPRTWYSFPYERLSSYRQVIIHHKGFAKTVQHLFPDINFDNHMFSRSSWNEIQNRRLFFENYANHMAFNHQDPEQWYLQPTEKILSFKGASRVISYHNDSVVKALVDLFPNIGLDESKFFTQWRHYGNRRRFFEEYAKSNGFDPLVPENWMMQPKDKIMAVEGAPYVIGYHKGRIIQALYYLFPTVFDSSKPLWSDRDLRRQFFEKYAQEKRYNPFIPENWYLQSREDIMSTKGINAVLSYHSNNLPRALMELFPDIGFTQSKLQSLSVWKDLAKRRKLFDDFAKEHGFDPNISENWYSQPKKTLLLLKELNFIKTYYQGSVANALVGVYPNLEKDRLPLNTWTKRECRIFFEKYATEKGFDCVSPQSWYSQKEDMLLREKGAEQILRAHGTISQALQDLFPEMEFDKFKIWAHAARNRREFFEEFAHKNKFDPLVPTNWYSVPLSSIMETNDATKVISYHGGSASNALCELFPDIGLDKNKLLTTHALKYNHMKTRTKRGASSEVYYGLQSKIEGRKHFFEDFATTNGFDPYNPENWYSQNRKSILAHKGGFAVISYYNHSIIKALVDIFPDIGLLEKKFSNQMC